MVGDVVRDIIALIRGPGNPIPRHIATLCCGQQKRQQRERRRIVQRNRHIADRHAGQTRFHVFHRIDGGAASADDFDIDLVNVVAPINRVARNHTERGGAGIDNAAHPRIVIFGRR